MNAIQHNHPGVLKALLPHIDPTWNQHFAIRHSCEKGFYMLVQILLDDKRVDPSVYGGCPLVLACANGQLEIIKLLLKDPRIDVAANNYAALRYCYQKNDEFVDKLVTMLAEQPQ